MKVSINWISAGAIYESQENKNSVLCKNRLTCKNWSPFLIRSRPQCQNIKMINSTLLDQESLAWKQRVSCFRQLNLNKLDFSWDDGQTSRLGRVSFLEEKPAALPTHAALGGILLNAEKNRSMFQVDCGTWSFPMTENETEWSIISIFRQCGKVYAGGQFKSCFSLKVRNVCENRHYEYRHWHFQNSTSESNFQALFRRGHRTWWMELVLVYIWLT